MSESVLIQPVESQVICRPYYEPTHYWDCDRATGCANKWDGRRPAAYWYKFADADMRRGQLSLELEEDRRDLALVNKLQADVKCWRQEKLGHDIELRSNSFRVPGKTFCLLC